MDQETLLHLALRHHLQCVLLSKANAIYNHQDVPPDDPFDVSDKNITVELWYEETNEMEEEEYTLNIPGSNKDISEMSIRRFSQPPVIVAIDIPNITVRLNDGTVVDTVEIRLEEDLSNLDARAEVNVGHIVYWLTKLMKKDISQEVLQRISKDSYYSRLIQEGYIKKYGDIISLPQIQCLEYDYQENTAMDWDDPRWVFVLEEIESF